MPLAVGLTKGLRSTSQIHLVEIINFTLVAAGGSRQAAIASLEVNLG